jgi:hypothetical protein
LFLSIDAQWVHSAAKGAPRTNAFRQLADFKDFDFNAIEMNEIERNPPPIPMKTGTLLKK